MKRFIILAIAAISIAFSSCSKEPEDLIVGTWNADLTNSIFSGKTAMDWDITLFQITLYENGSYSGHILEEDEFGSFVGTYFLGGNRLVFDGDIEFVGTIDELSKKKLAFSYMDRQGMNYLKFDKAK